jgi:hypothetical protein
VCEKLFATGLDSSKMYFQNIEDIPNRVSTRWTFAQAFIWQMKSNDKIVVTDHRILARTIANNNRMDGQATLLRSRVELGNEESNA